MAIQQRNITRLRIPDNRIDGRPLSDCRDVSSSGNEAFSEEEIVRDLSMFAGKRLGRLVKENEDLLVFPQSLDAYKDDIEQLQICSYDSDSHRLHTGNMMGFVGCGNTLLRIHSRFDKDSNDYFLHYMLQKVFCPHLVNLDYSNCREPVFDFLLYLFPFYLNRAMAQGIFKEYRRFEYNDSKVKGTIDVGRHIRQNVPFAGKIAYNTREYSHDNRITQLIRHTIEYIKSQPLGKGILETVETRNNVRQIVDATPTYALGARRRVMLDNVKDVRHPYFTNYTALQKLCLRILRHEELKFGNDRDKIHGILFDGAWLWEEYLNTILKPHGFIHAENKTGKNPCYLLEGNSYARYPDFYIPERIVVDAKYKHLGGEIARDDIHQIISYLHVLNAKETYLAYPIDNDFETGKRLLGTLKGMGGTVGLIGLKIPRSCQSFKEFVEKITEEEKWLLV